MRVLFVNRANAETSPGGDTVQMHQTADALRQLGVDVEIRLGKAGDSKPFDLVHLFNLQLPDFIFTEASEIYATGKKMAISTIYWDFGAELLIASSRRWTQLASLIGMPAALALARKRVNQHARAPRGKMAEALQMADLWLPNSQAEVEHLKALTKIERTVHVIRNAIDPDQFDPSREHALPKWAAERKLQSKGYLLIAARIEPHKNQLAYLNAIQGLDIPVVLVGTAPDEDYLRKCQEAGAFWAGQLQGEELVSGYAHAKVHALPSFRETPGLASLEAAAMGCAIVSTDAGCAREYLSEDAQYCTPTSAGSMRAATEQAWRQGPPKGLSERIRSAYTWHATAEATLRAYEELLRT